jgi:hypothetical protein
VPRARRRIRSRSHRRRPRAKPNAPRIATANIARANSAATADESGGLFDIRKSFNSATIKFRGWNTNFKRNWLKQVNVERGAEQDIETAWSRK